MAAAELLEGAAGGAEDALRIVHPHAHDEDPLVLGHGLPRRLVDGLAILELAHERVILGVGDFRRVEHIVQMLVAAKFVAERRNLASAVSRVGSLSSRNSSVSFSS